MISSLLLLSLHSTLLLNNSIHSSISCFLLLHHLLHSLLLGSLRARLGKRLAAAGLQVAGAGPVLRASIDDMTFSYHGALERAMSRAASSALPSSEVTA